MAKLVPVKGAYIEDDGGSGLDRRFTVIATASDGARYRHSGLGDSPSFTERKALEIAHKVRERKTIDLEHWSPMAHGMTATNDAWIEDFFGVR